MALKPETFLRDLIAIPSVSSLSNEPVITYAESHLKGFRLVRHTYRDAAGRKKVNLVAHSKPGAAELALICHTDTVPSTDDLLRPTLRQGRLRGRGACDVKGFLACILSAVAGARPEKPLAVILTSDEEIGCLGAKFLAKKKAFRARYAIIGEPTCLRPVRAGKGYGLAEIVVRGREAHSAYPQHGHSAILDGARIATALERVSKKLATRRNRDFDPPFTTLNIGLIHGGTAKNVIPGECRLTVEWRPVPGQPLDLAPRLIREALHGFDAQLDIKRLDPPFAPSRTASLVTLAESLTGHRSIAVPFGTEAAHLAPLVDEVIVFGAGHMTVAHTDHEFVPVAELRACAAHLRTLIERICG